MRLQQFYQDARAMGMWPADAYIYARCLILKPWLIAGDTTVGQIIKHVAPWESEPCDEPDHDDSVKCCPDCERPNQFGELCAACARERGELAYA